MEDYLREARNNVPETMRNMEDALLIWLTQHGYDSNDALEKLIESFK